MYCLLRSAQKKKHSDKEKLEVLADFMAEMEKSYQEVYPDDPCPLEGGYRGCFERMFEKEFGGK